jgi:hypothetical protein
MLASNKLSSFPSSPAIPPPHRYGGIITARKRTAIPLRAGDAFIVAGNGGVEGLWELTPAPSGVVILLQFVNNITLVHNGRLLLPGGVGWSLPAGSVAWAFSEGKGAWRVFPLRADGASLPPATMISSSGFVTIDSSYFGKTIFLDSTSGDIGLNIAAIAGLPAEWRIRLVRLSSANNITVIFNGSETCDGRNQARLISKGDAATIRTAPGGIFVTENARWMRRELIFNSSTTFIVLNEVPIGCLDYEIEGVAAGSSGAGSKITGPQRQGGGAAGAWGRKRISASLDTSLTITIPTGGAPVAASNNGTTGNPGGNLTAVGANLGTLTLQGGQAPFVGGAGGIGGAPSGAWDESARGEDGYTSENNGSQVGFGGSSRFGAGAKNNIGSPGDTGAGGSCSNHVNTSDMSGAGGNGRLLVHI